MIDHIEFKALNKEFDGITVLHDISLTLKPAQVYGLLGENGAGKSTLVKILAGYENISSGELLINNQVRNFKTCRDAEKLGIILIHQEFNLAEHLSISQNIYLGHELKKNGFLDDKAMYQASKKSLALIGLNIDPDTKISQLIIAEKQLVEIAKALSRKAQLLIMDEPTATLTTTETMRLFKLIKRLRDNGVTIIYISHKLDEVEQITDEVIIMRDGHFITRAPTNTLDRQKMANLMVGRELTDLFPPKIMPAKDAESILIVENFQVEGFAQDINFDVKAGEILGFAGLVGAGRTELFEGILGLRKSCGKLKYKGKDIAFKCLLDAVESGVTYLSEDRKGKGLHINLGLRENLTLMALKYYANPLLNVAQERDALKLAITEFGIKASAKNKAAVLSGGNQQKLALAKVLHSRPSLVILDEPTRGVDVGAKRDIYFLIEALAQEGLAVIVISSELIELIGLCHRVAVMHACKISTILNSDQLSEKEIIGHATGTK